MEVFKIQDSQRHIEKEQNGGLTLSDLKTWQSINRITERALSWHEIQHSVSGRTASGSQLTFALHSTNFLQGCQEHSGKKEKSLKQME